ncbi:hypothetical protein Glove_87g195 [Diversispora epigaea]|uniref:TLDc domain-containing protein n=1 Tax=Diversispora epigaea TaxID=1348612 RepID=A0A397JGK4_9GLOM|nr:hypothetical protein Glove_87g195 [Diversispora epigaea]
MRWNYKKERESISWYLISVEGGHMDKKVENKEKSLTAHSNVLKYRSSYFRQKLENIQPNENNIKTINKPNVSAKIFDAILNYVWWYRIVNLMLAAKKFEFEELSNKLETFLIETHFSIVSRRLLTEKILNDLQNFCNDILTTLRQCLQHIHYFRLLNFEIFDKIKPYKKILDKQLWEDINQHSFAPERPNSKRIFFNIISLDHASEISSWIDCRTITYSTTNIPYKFELILRGTTNGFAPQTFWNICHGHTCTVVVAKVKGTDEIIGGYNPLAWDSACYGEYRWMETKDSFIFSNDQNIEGPHFGFDFCRIASVICLAILTKNLYEHYQITFLLIIMKLFDIEVIELAEVELVQVDEVV